MKTQNSYRVILHCDMNNFFASVELLDRPDLADKPVAVSGDPQGRHGIILAKNQLAKEKGVVTAETIWQARKKCPNLQLVKPHMEKYKAYCTKINAIYQRYTDMVEPFSIDESWLDVTASQRLFGTGKEIADSIRLAVTKELGLTLSVGVSFNKIFAKMGSEYKKPDATTEITPQNYKDLLWPLPAGELFGVGKATAQKLAQSSILTIGDIANASRKYLESLLGKQGASIWDHANGIDDSPVALYTHREPIKSVGNGITFKRDLITDREIATAIKAISDTVAGRLRKYNLKAWGIKLDIKDPFFKVISRQKQLDAPTWLATEIAAASTQLLNSSWKKGAPIRLLTITGINLTDQVDQEQLTLFQDNISSKERVEKMELTMDQVRQKYGSNAIGFASVVTNDLGIQIKSEDEDKAEKDLPSASANPKKLPTST